MSEHTISKQRLIMTARCHRKFDARSPSGHCVNNFQFYFSYSRLLERFDTELLPAVAVAAAANVFILLFFPTTRSLEINVWSARIRVVALMPFGRGVAYTRTEWCFWIFKCNYHGAQMQWSQCNLVHKPKYITCGWQTSPHLLIKYI